MIKGTDDRTHWSNGAFQTKFVTIKRTYMYFLKHNDVGYATKIESVPTHNIKFKKKHSYFS